MNYDPTPKTFAEIRAKHDHLIGELTDALPRCQPVAWRGNEPLYAERLLLTAARAMRTNGSTRESR